MDTNLKAIPTTREEWDMIDAALSRNLSHFCGKYPLSEWSDVDKTWVTAMTQLIAKIGLHGEAAYAEGHCLEEGLPL